MTKVRVTLDMIRYDVEVWDVPLMPNENPATLIEAIKADPQEIWWRDSTMYDSEMIDDEIHQVTDFEVL